MSDKYVETLPFRSLSGTIKLAALLGAFAFFAYLFFTSHPTGKVMEIATPQAPQAPQAQNIPMP